MINIYAPPTTVHLNSFHQVANTTRSRKLLLLSVSQDIARYYRALLHHSDIAGMCGRATCWPLQCWPKTQANAIIQYVDNAPRAAEFIPLDP